MTTFGDLLQCHFEEINIARHDPNILVIDVREIEELIEVGRILGAINIPLRDIPIALSPEMSNEEFKKKYLLDKPQMDRLIIFTCRSGRRSGIAQQEAIKLGYKHVKNYTGGWLDWEEQIKK